MANVDLYPGCIFKALGIPSACFTLLLAVPKFGGWLAHWNEYLSKRTTDDAQTVRPRQVYHGYVNREYERELLPPISAPHDVAATIKEDEAGFFMES